MVVLRRRASAAIKSTPSLRRKRIRKAYPLCPRGTAEHIPFCCLTPNLFLDRVLDRLYELEQVHGFSSALIGAIGKFKGYYARLALVLHVAAEQSPSTRTRVNAQQRNRRVISKDTAEATEQLLFDFLLPHTFGLYDVVANGGQDRDTIRAIGDFILASDKDRLRPSDLTAGVRRLRNQPANKIAEWASRFCALGWLRPEDERATVPKAWLVDPGLRTYFAARRQHAQAARAAAHAILKAGGHPAMIGV